LKTNRFYLRCAAGDETLFFESFDDDGDIYISYMMDAFYKEQESVLSRFWGRVKSVLSLLFYGEYRLYDIVIEKDDLKSFKKFVSEIGEENEPSDS
jgi:hypothetical protein